MGVRPAAGQEAGARGDAQRRGGVGAVEGDAAGGQAVECGHRVEREALAPGEAPRNWSAIMMTMLGRAVEAAAERGGAAPRPGAPEVMPRKVRLSVTKFRI
jgi:hypothetical protein